MTDLLTAVSIIFIVAGPFLLIANRFNLPTVPLLILAGVVVGLFIDEGITLELAQYGIALLVFSFGVSIQLSGTRTVLVDSEIAAVGQILLLGLLGSLAGVLIGMPIGEAVYLGIAGALSSTIVGTALLAEEMRANLVRGRLANSIQFVQDLFAIAIVLVIGAEAAAVMPIATELGYGLALLLGGLLVNRYLFDAIGRLAGDSTELLIIGVVSILVVFVGVAEYLEVSIVVGAFAAGIGVRQEPAEYLGLFNGLESIKEFFAAIFFVTIGALVAVPTTEKVLIASVLVVLTAIVKPLVTTAILLYQGYEPRSAVLTSLSIDQVSEFALIIVIEALLIGLLTQSVFDAIIFATAVTMVTSSFSRRYDEQIYRAIADRWTFPRQHKRIDEWSEVPDELANHVIIVGYGRLGRQVVETCEARDQPYVVIENDPRRRSVVESNCESFVFGDAMERYTWEKASVESSTVVVSAVDSEPVSRRLLQFGFGSDLILRTSDPDRALTYLDEGAIYVSVPELLAGEELVGQLRALFDGDLTRAELREQRRSALEEHATLDSSIPT